MIIQTPRPGSRWLTILSSCQASRAAVVTNEVVNQQTFRASETASGKARERRHGKPYFKRAALDVCFGYTGAPTPCHEP